MLKNRWTLVLIVAILVAAVTAIIPQTRAAAHQSGCVYYLPNRQCLTERDLENIYLKVEKNDTDQLYRKATRHLSGAFWVRHRGYLYLVRHTQGIHGVFQGGPSCKVISRVTRDANIERHKCEDVLGIIETSEKFDVTYHEVVHAAIRADLIDYLIANKRMTEEQAIEAARDLVSWLKSTNSGYYWRMNELAPIWFECGVASARGLDMRNMCKYTLDRPWTPNTFFEGTMPTDVDDLTMIYWIATVQKDY